MSRVLPMGFVNSVSIAEHMHRNIVRWSAGSLEPPAMGEGELPKDKGMTSASNMYRVYLDNFDHVERLDERTAMLVKGTPSAQVLKLREDYMALGLPRHTKKAVERQFKAEVQGGQGLVIRFAGSRTFGPRLMQPKGTSSSVWWLCLHGHVSEATAVGFE